MTLEGQPIRRRAAPGAATLERRRTHAWQGSPASLKGGMQVHRRRALQPLDTPLPFYTPSGFQNIAFNMVLLCNIGNKDGWLDPAWPAVLLAFASLPLEQTP